MPEKDKRNKMRCEEKTMKIAPEFIESLKPLAKHDREVGGGFNFNKDGSMRGAKIFESSNKSKNQITFIEKWDVEFHTHYADEKNEEMKSAVRRASSNDIASTFVSAKEEIISTPGYLFMIRIYDRYQFEKTREMIQKKYKKEGKKFKIPFDRYLAFFSEIELAIRRKYSDQKDFTRAWNKELEKYGIRIEKLDSKNPEFTMHGKCERR